MFAIELSVLLVLAAALAGLTLFGALRTAIPQIAALRQALAECPEQLEVRFTIRETVVGYNDGKVVPLRRRTVLSRPRPQTARAAA